MELHEISLASGQSEEFDPECQTQWVSGLDVLGYQSIHQDYCENTGLSSSEDGLPLREHFFLTTEEAKLNSNLQAVEFFSKHSETWFETLEQASQGFNEKKDGQVKKIKLFWTYFLSTESSGVKLPST